MLANMIFRRDYMLSFLFGGLGEWREENTVSEWGKVVPHCSFGSSFVLTHCISGVSSTIG